MTRESSYVLVIDLGSGGPKVALVADSGRVVAHASARIATHYLPDGGAEQDPDAWWGSFDRLARQILDPRPVPLDRVVAIACTGQWSVTVPVAADGRALSRAVHWTDRRGAPYTRDITRGLIKIQDYGLTRLLGWMWYTGGAPTHSGADALAHMLFLKHERPDIYLQTHKFLEPADYLNLRLTGRFAASHASIYPYLLTNNRHNPNIDYAPRLLAWSGIPREKLPDLVPAGATVGTLLSEVATAWGLSPQVKVVASLGDSQAAALGAGTVDDFDAHVCVGTSSWLTCFVPFRKTDLSRYLATMPSALPGRNMVMAELGPAGKCVEVFLDNWLYPEDDIAIGQRPADAFERLERLAATVPAGSEGLLFLPWLNGGGPPSGDSALRGGFLNQSLPTGRAQAARAIFEGVAYNLRWLRDSVQAFCGRRFASLNFIGGGARSPVWCQILADVFDCPIRQVADPQVAIARGAALAALVALEKLPVEEIPRRVEFANTYLPSATNRAIYEQSYRNFLAAYRANRKLFRQMNNRPVDGHR
ncbi:MAG: FGGY-family carbohydrate kinase [Pirellulales bacterium]|nr:FGGY-family carbohydrate kinase [Pirellulales bacterium]